MNEEIGVILDKSDGVIKFGSGKVRDLWELTKTQSDSRSTLASKFLLIVTTDRISIFDFILGVEIPYKGEVLNALNIFWIGKLRLKHNIRAYGAGVCPANFPGIPNNEDLQKRGIIVVDEKPHELEFIYRNHLTGSGYRKYQETGQCYGHNLPAGLWDGAKIPNGPIFTPTTKAKDGHDQPITLKEAISICGADIIALGQCKYIEAAQRALGKGIIIADTKFEFSKNGFIDEVLTPDSSRFWDQDEYQKAQKDSKAPTGYDKEPVRQWGMTVQTPWGKGINSLQPENPEHQKFVQDLKVPDSVIAKTMERYLAVFKRLTGMRLQDFQNSEMHLAYRV